MARRVFSKDDVALLSGRSATFVAEEKLITIDDPEWRHLFAPTTPAAEILEEVEGLEADELMLQRVRRRAA